LVETDPAVKPDRLKSMLRGQPELRRRNKTLHRVGQDNSRPLWAWQATDHIVIYGGKPENFESVPDYPLSGYGHFSTTIRQFIQDQVTVQTHAWLVGQLQDWQKSFLGPPLSRLVKGEVNLVAKLNDLGFTLHFGDDILLQAQAGLRDSQAAAAVERALKDFGMQSKSSSVQVCSWQWHGPADSFLALCRNFDVNPSLP
jgi:hypothetical protein